MIKLGLSNPFQRIDSLAQLQRVLQANPDLAATLGGDYLVARGIVVGRSPVSDAEINRFGRLASGEDVVCRLTPLRASNRPDSVPILYASISCK